MIHTRVHTVSSTLLPAAHQALLLSPSDDGDDGIPSGDQDHHHHHHLEDDDRGVPPPSRNSNRGGGGIKSPLALSSEGGKVGGGFTFDTVLPPRTTPPHPTHRSTEVKEAKGGDLAAELSPFNKGITFDGAAPVSGRRTSRRLSGRT